MLMGPLAAPTLAPPLHSPLHTVLAHVAGAVHIPSTGVNLGLLGAPLLRTLLALCSWHLAVLAHVVFAVLHLSTGGSQGPLAARLLCTLLLSWHLAVLAHVAVAVQLAPTGGSLGLLAAPLLHALPVLASRPQAPPPQVGLAVALLPGEHRAAPLLALRHVAGCPLQQGPGLAPFSRCVVLPLLWVRHVVRHCGNVFTSIRNQAAEVQLVGTQLAEPKCRELFEQHMGTAFTSNGAAHRDKA
jgi:hypothetical protein